MHGVLGRATLTRRRSTLDMNVAEKERAVKPNSLAIRDREGRYPTANAILVALSAGGRSSRVFLRRADRPLSLPLLQHVHAARPSAWFQPILTCDPCENIRLTLFLLNELHRYTWWSRYKYKRNIFYLVVGWDWDNEELWAKYLSSKFNVW